MPKYTFICGKCGSQKHKYVSIDIDTLHCYECGDTMKRNMPKILGTEVKETIDTYTGAKSNQNTNLVKDRHDQYYWEIEVPRLVEKYSLETCLDQKWLVYDDNGQLVINKPPSKR